MLIDLDATQTGSRTIQLFAAAPGAAISWRLLSGNNREIGRGAGTFPDVASARAALYRLQADAADLHTAVTRVGNVWQWTVSSDGTVIATSRGRYDRQIRCRQALTQFVSEFAVGIVGGTVTWTQSRRWTVPAMRVVGASDRRTRASA